MEKENREPNIQGVFETSPQFLIKKTINTYLEVLNLDEPYDVLTDYSENDSQFDAPYVNDNRSSQTKD